MFFDGHPRVSRHHAHPLLPVCSGNASRWRCHAHSGTCLSGLSCRTSNTSTTTNSCAGVPRWQCTRGCDFDLCGACMEAEEVDKPDQSHTLPQERKEVDVHTHALRRFENSSSSWSCDTPFSTCRSNLKSGQALPGLTPRQGVLRWRCAEGCDYDLCEPCLNALLERKEVDVHTHALRRFENSSSSWSCDTPFSTCRSNLKSGHALPGFTPRQGVLRWKCAEGCDYDLCEPCLNALLLRASRAQEPVRESLAIKSALFLDDSDGDDSLDGGGDGNAAGPDVAAGGVEDPCCLCGICGTSHSLGECAEVCFVRRGSPLTVYLRRHPHRALADESAVVVVVRAPVHSAAVVEQVLRDVKAVRPSHARQCLRRLALQERAALVRGQRSDESGNKSPPENACQEAEEDDSKVLVPEAFLCPITTVLMVDPVILPSSATSFERSAVTRWIQEHGTDPVSRSPCKVSDLIPNRALALAIQQWKKQTSSAGK